MSRYISGVSADIVRVIIASEIALTLDEVADISGHPSGSVRTAVAGLLADGQLVLATTPPGPRPARDLRGMLRAAGRAVRRTARGEAE